MWCGYSDMAEFQSEASKLKPTESARVTYSSGRLAEVTYQIEPESADWVVVDKYTPSDNEVVLRRANLLAQENLEVIQDAIIRGGKAEPLRTTKVTTLQGKEVEGPRKIDFPDVPVRTSLSKIPFMLVVAEMRNRSLPKLCKKSE